MQWITWHWLWETVEQGDERRRAKGWQRKFAWLPKDINRGIPFTEAPRHWIWLEPYWERFLYSWTDGDSGYGGIVVKRSLKPPPVC